ncbi:MAG: nitroreductase/quinone reductase family protein [Candidatus Binatia bacterium]|jgi:hypothetical protein|nr:nitroreductase/quinone reductase family protein [Candidatus Binatia bacterium]MDG1958918.1 nitroreductase/quinone reductase family protein [Candidatus Binatia bacterium]MDG2008704.1 nitroreductase/quinone reductase family protein [Candidatus Binatia bacterium]
MTAQAAFYRYMLNPVMRALLRSPLHGIASGSIGILHFKGRRTGRSLDTPLSFMREGETIWLLSATTTRWWMNFRGADALPVEMEIAGKYYPGHARLFEGDSEALRDGVRRFIAAVPRDAPIYALKLDAQKQVREESLAAGAADLIVVRVDLG